MFSNMYQVLSKANARFPQVEQVRSEKLAQRAQRDFTTPTATPTAPAVAQQTQVSTTTAAAPAVAVAQQQNSRQTPPSSYVEQTPPPSYAEMMRAGAPGPSSPNRGRTVTRR